MDYEDRKQCLAKHMRAANGQAVRLAKPTSNLFRDRRGHGQALDVSDFGHVLAVDTAANTIETEGMVTYEALTDAALAHGLMPAVVPQLKSITIGGAVSGIGIESSSFRYGLPHETVQEMDVLLGNGEVVTCTPDNTHRDLFFGLANSYGTLGYILRLKILAVPAKPFVRLNHVHCTDADDFFERLAAACDSEVDFIDGVVFDRGRHYLTLGEFIDQAPYSSDYTYLQIYYRSIPARAEDYLSVRDYLWRWDTDWFWCSKNLYLENRLLRMLLGRERLNSITYQKVMRWNARLGITRRLGQLSGRQRESVIQDVDIPIANAGAFLDFFHRQIGIRPLWICPVRHAAAHGDYPLFPMRTDTLYINFGFWDSVLTTPEQAAGHFNRLIEKQVKALGGIKSLYSQSCYPEDEFWSLYNGDHYRALKVRYDPGDRLKDLYRKCVLHD